MRPDAAPTASCTRSTRVSTPSRSAPSDTAQTPIAPELGVGVGAPVRMPSARAAPQSTLTNADLTVLATAAGRIGQDDREHSADPAGRTRARRQRPYHGAATDETIRPGHRRAEPQFHRGGRFGH